MKSGNGPIDVYLCPDNNKENVPPSLDDTDIISSGSDCSTVKSFNSQDECQNFECSEDSQLGGATLSSMNSNTPKVKVEEGYDMMACDGKSDFSISPLIPLEPNFKAEDYLFSLDSNEGIADLFDVDAFL